VPGASAGVAPFIASQNRAAPPASRLRFQLELDVALIVQPDTKGVLRSLTTAPLS
jgi:hypothetical protein